MSLSPSNGIEGVDNDYTPAVGGGDDENDDDNKNDDKGNDDIIYIISLTN